MIQVLVNLLSNAIKFSPEGGTINLCAESLDERLEFRVADEGPGGPAEFQSTIFERLGQAQGESKQLGTGLGLAICKELVEQHGGTIGADSKEGQGATFWFKIPVRQDGQPCCA